MKTRNIRKAQPEDLERILEMYAVSRQRMRADGNMEQWVGYPTAADFEEDCRRGVSYIVEEGDAAVGTFALVDGEEPTYGLIDHGRWIDPTTPYSTLHRLASASGASGIAAEAMRFAKHSAAHLRADTHAANRPMHHILEKEGFVYCGQVYMDDGAPRDAYEWWRMDEVRSELKEYIEQEVLPLYAAFDQAHRQEHARRVIGRAMQMAHTDYDMVYAAAAMHDLGLAESRADHHRASARIIRQCEALRRWFSEEEVQTIAEAAEDHRASATERPRSEVGCIVAEADRDVEPYNIVWRTVQYGLSHFPSLSHEEQWERTVAHLNEKYAEGGYIRLWLSPSPNEEPLRELRELIADRHRLRTLFEQYSERRAE